MANSRIRTRNKYRTLTKTTTSLTGAVQSANFHSQTQTESMSDFYIPGWANKLATGFEPVYPIEASRTLRAAAVIGATEKIRELQRFIPPVQNLVYSSNIIEEPLDTVRFKYNAGGSVYVEIQGCVTQQLYTVWHPSMTDPPVVLPQPADITNGMKSEVLRRAGSTEFGFGEPIGEIRQTLDLIRHPLTSIRRTMRVFSRKAENISERTSKKQAAALGRLWAESNWAVIPGIRTIDNVLEATADYFYKTYRDAYRTVSVKNEVSGFAAKWGETTCTFPYSGYGAQPWFVRLHTQIKKEYEFSVGIKVHHNDNGSLPALLGLRGRDIPSVLWELCPLSFLVDRLYNIKGCLQAMSNFMSTNVSFTGGWETLRQTTTTTKFMDTLYPNGSPSLKWVLPPRTKPWVNTSFVYNRSKWIPNIRDSYPPHSAGALTSTLRNQADLAAVTAIKTERLPGYKELERLVVKKIGRMG